MLVNTCAVRDNAEQRVIGRVGELQRHKREGGVLGVVGCMAQRLGPTLLAKVPRVDLVVGPDAYRNLPELLGMAIRASGSPTPSFVPGNTMKTCLRCAKQHPPHSSRYSEAATTAALSASSPIPGVLSAAVGWQTSFARSPVWPSRESPRSRCWARQSTAITMASTTSPICCVPWVGWSGCGACASPAPIPPTLRPGSSRPWPRLPPCVSMCTCRFKVDRMRCSNGCCGATPVSAIWRWWSSSGSAVPGITFSTDIIVGFPGETEADFEADTEPRREADFDDAYTFKYSVREGTPAVRLRDHIDDDVAAARLARLVEAVRTQSAPKEHRADGTS